MRRRYLTLDVFTDRRFGGNPLAVVLEAEGLDAAAMQRIAAEFNFSETTFVLPPADPAHTARVRIFTPRAEMAFAGHPTVGTALALAWTDRAVGTDALVLEEGAGPVPVRLAYEQGRAVQAVLAAPAGPSCGERVDPSSVAQALDVPTEVLVTAGGLPCDGFAGNWFLFAEVRSLGILEGLRPARPTAGLSRGGEEGIFVFARTPGDPDHDIRARMFAPAHGIAEDPATGSAVAGLAGLLASEAGCPDGELRWRIGQGVEMGRPSLIEAGVLCAGGEVTRITVGGRAVLVCEGHILTD